MCNRRNAWLWILRTKISKHKEIGILICFSYQNISWCVTLLEQINIVLFVHIYSSDVFPLRMSDQRLSFTSFTSKINGANVFLKSNLLKSSSSTCEYFGTVDTFRLSACGNWKNISANICLASIYRLLRTHVVAGIKRGPFIHTLIFLRPFIATTALVFIHLTSQVEQDIKWMRIYICMYVSRSSRRSCPFIW